MKQWSSRLVTNLLEKATSKCCDIWPLNNVDKTPDNYSQFKKIILSNG